jgi:hypothetical protein
MASVRAKFRVHHISKNDYGTEVFFSPVYSTDPNHENKKVWDATPSGELHMTIKNEPAAQYFQSGQEYYLDFTLAPAS